MTFFSSIIVLTGLVLNVMMNMNIWAILSSALGLITVITFYLLSRRPVDYYPLFFPFLAIVLLLICSTWFVNAGYNGNILYLTIVCFALMYVTAKEKHRQYIYVVFLLFSTILIALQHFDPDLVIDYDNETQRFWDIVLGNVLYISFLYFLLKTVLSSYDRQTSILSLKMQQVRDNEEKYRRIIENINDIYYRLDREGLIEMVNPSIEAFLGYKPEEMVGRKVDEFLSNSGIQRHLIENMFKENIHIKDVAIEFVSKCGETKVAAISSKRVTDSSGNPVGIEGILRDTTERVQAEEMVRSSELKFRTLFTQSRDAIYIRTTEGKITDYNPAMLKLFGYSPGEMQGLDIKQLYHELPDRDQIAHHIQMNEGVNDLEIKLKTKYGVVIDCLVSSGEFYDDSGRAIGVQGTIRDLTESKQVEEQLRQTLKMESVGRLAGGIAHDFNNMLMAILGNAELALDHLKEHNPSYWNIIEIQNAARRSANITRQLLGFARKQVIIKKTIDLNEMIDASRNMLHRLVGEVITLNLKPEKEIWSIWMDPTQVDQILMNLCVNARDAIGGHGVISIETSNLTLTEDRNDTPWTIPSGEYVVLSITDNGCGIDKDVIPHIFEPFFTTKPVGEGTGLGLSTVFGIVKQNGGSITVDSKPGRGSTFKIYLPRTEKQIETTPEPAPKEKVAKETRAILFVEDEPVLLELGKHMIEQLGYKVFASQDPLEAITLFRQNASDISLVISDVVMPGINGTVLYKKLKETKPSLSAVFISGYGSDIPGLGEVLKEGAFFLEKPFNIQTLADAIKHYIN